jgi:hypothetical protein
MRRETHKGDETKKKKPSGFTGWQSEIKSSCARDIGESISYLEEGIKALNGMRSNISSDDSLSPSEISTLLAQLDQAAAAKQKEISNRQDQIKQNEDMINAFKQQLEDDAP